MLALPHEAPLNQDLMDQLIDIESAREFAAEQVGHLFTFDKVIKEKEYRPSKSYNEEI